MQADATKKVVLVTGGNGLVGMAVREQVACENEVAVASHVGEWRPGRRA